MSSQIINNLPGIEGCSYLELGVFDNANFEKINSRKKWSVDLNGKALFTGSTDDYFSSISKKVRFDIIFIDANHDYDFVLRDFNNSVIRCNKWILIHDLIPPSARYSKPSLCSDSFKILYYLLKETNFEIYPMNSNFGLTLIKMPADQINPPEKYKNIDYEEFLNFIKNKKLYSNEEIITILRKENV
jgi:hypothetical protein